MVAMLILIGTIYDYNLGHVEVQISDTSSNMSANIFVPEKIALIFGPFSNQDCTHIWT